MKNTKNTASIVTGFFFIVVGCLFLLEKLAPASFEIPWYIRENLFTWHTVFTLIGIIILTGTSNKVLGGLLLAIGIIGYIPGFWPIIFIAMGIFLLMKKKTTQEFNHDYIENDIPHYLNEIAIFGGGAKNFQSNRFAGGKMTAIFGGMEINLTNCKLNDGDNVLDLVAIFGGATIIVPPDWNIQVEVLPLLGGFGDKRFRNPAEVSDPSKRLIIKGVVVFGGGEIKN